jgi:hypothetical protein
MFYPLERLLNVGKLAFTANGISMTTYNLHHRQWVSVTERLFREEDQSVATLALLPDADGETLIQSDDGTFKKVSAILVWGQRVAVVLILLLMGGAPFSALVWGIRKVLGKLRNTGPFSLRLMPLLSTALLTAFVGLFVMQRNDMLTIGVCSWVAVGIMLLSIAFPLAAAANLFIVYRERSAPMNRLSYWHAVLAAAAAAAVAIYMGCWGLIGLRLWA